MPPEEPDRWGSYTGRFHSTHWNDVLAARDPATAGGPRGPGRALPGLLVSPLRLRPPQGLRARAGRGPDPGVLLRRARAQLPQGRGPREGEVPVVPADLVRELSEERARQADSGQAGRAGQDRLDRSGDAEARYHREPSHIATPERLYDRRWALTLLDRALDRLERSMADRGKGPLFDRLKPRCSGTAKRRRTPKWPPNSA